MELTACVVLDSAAISAWIEVYDVRMYRSFGKEARALSYWQGT